MFKFILIGVLLLQLSTLALCYVEALTANLDNGLTHFQPMIAMVCGLHDKFHNRYLNEQKQWVTDNDPTATCIKDKLDILEYCRKVYPKKDIRNIVESNLYYRIDNWKPVKSSRHHLTRNEKEHFVKPIRCLEGNFQSDALLVPEHCVFDHIHNSSVCEANVYWNKTANQSCKDKGKMLQSYAMLLPCGIVSIFNGVEFVCCPLSTSVSQNEISDRPINNEYKNESPDFRLPSNSLPDDPKTNERLIKSSSNKKLFTKNKQKHSNKLDQEEYEDDNSSMDDDSEDQNNGDQDTRNEGDDFEENTADKKTLPRKVSTNKKLSAKMNQEEDDDEYYDDDYEENDATSTSTTTSTTTETPLEHYYSHFDSKNEHNLFKLAEESLKKIQLEKMKKVFKDYADFQSRLNEKSTKKSKKSQKKVRLDDSELDENLRKKMEKRYEEALESLEMQNNEEKQQLNAMHQQRVLTLINMKKQEATDCYTSSLNQTPLKPRKIQKCLEKLMKSLEKDRIHTLHHYKHLLQVSSKLALKEKAATLTHLENLIVIANRSISMLNKYPTLNDKIRNHIIAFWHNLRGVPFNQVISRDTEQQIMEKYEEEIAQKQQEKEHRKMLQEVKKEEELESKSSTAKKTTDEMKSEPEHNKATDKTNQQSSESNLSIADKSTTSKQATSNIKHTARYSTNSKSNSKQLGNKQVNSVLVQHQTKPIAANMQHSRQHHESSFKISEQLPEQHHLTGFKFEQTSHAYLTFGIASMAILLASISGIVIYRNGNNNSSMHLSQGFVALQTNQQQQMNNEQQQVEALQINGYENPTYKFLEKNI